MHEPMQGGYTEVIATTRDSSGQKVELIGLFVPKNRNSVDPEDGPVASKHLSFGLLILEKLDLPTLAGQRNLHHHRSRSGRCQHVVSSCVFQLSNKLMNGRAAHAAVFTAGVLALQRVDREHIHDGP